MCLHSPASFQQGLQILLGLAIFILDLAFAPHSSILCFLNPCVVKHTGSISFTLCSDFDLFEEILNTLCLFHAFKPSLSWTRFDCNTLLLIPRLFVRRSSVSACL